MRSIPLRLCVCAAGLGLAFSAAGQVSSTFDTDLEGWAVYSDGHISHDPAFGNPAGAACMTDQGSGGYFGFLAPAAYRGDKSAYFGGTLTYDIHINNSTTAGPTQPDVVITGSGITIVLDLPVPPGDQWDTREINLDSSADWRINSLSGTSATDEEIQIVLGDVTLLRIRGEFSTQTSDVTYLDNVLLAPGQGCAADTNHDGMLTPADFTAWIAAFNAGAPECDQNGDGLCTPADFTAWIANYNAGC